jgi:hypothetical protein
MELWPKPWIDEPHPVGLLTSFGKFLRDLLIDVRLSVQEPNKVGFNHGHAPVGRR